MMDIFFDQTKIGTKNWVILRMFNKKYRSDVDAF